MKQNHYNTIDDSQLQNTLYSIPHAAAAASNLDATIPLRSAQTELHKTIDLQHTTVEHIAVMHQFQCTKYLNTCKHNSTASTKEEKKSTGTLSYIARAVRARFHAKATTPAPVAHTSQLFSATEAPLIRKNTMFRANPNIQIASMMIMM